MKIGEKPYEEFYDGAPGGGGQRLPFTLGGLIAGLVIGLVLARVIGIAGVAGFALALATGAAGAGAGWVVSGGGGQEPPNRVPTLMPVVEGKPLWQRLDEAGVRVKGFLVPMSTPIEELEQGQMNGGLGVPDACGNPSGIFYLFSTSKKDVPKGDTRTTSSQGKVIRLTGAGDEYVAEIPGPTDVELLQKIEDELKDVDKKLQRARKDAALEQQRDDLEKQKGDCVARLELRVRRAGDGVVEVAVGDHKVTAAEGEWSDWIPVPFSAASAARRGRAGSVSRGSSRRNRTDSNLLLSRRRFRGPGWRGGRG